MISEILIAEETVFWNIMLVAFVGAKMWFVLMTMYTMSFTLIAKKNKNQRETGIPADNNLTLVRF
jgi:hypothetical protein